MNAVLGWVFVGFPSRILEVLSAHLLINRCDVIFVEMVCFLLVGIVREPFWWKISDGPRWGSDGVSAGGDSGCKYQIIAWESVEIRAVGKSCDITPKILIFYDKVMIILKPYREKHSRSLFLHFFQNLFFHKNEQYNTISVARYKLYTYNLHLLNFIAKIFLKTAFFCVFLEDANVEGKISQTWIKPHRLPLGTFFHFFSFIFLKKGYNITFVDDYFRFLPSFIWNHENQPLLCITSACVFY